MIVEVNCGDGDGGSGWSVDERMKCLRGWWLSGLYEVGHDLDLVFEIQCEGADDGEVAEVVHEDQGVPAKGGKICVCGADPE